MIKHLNKIFQITMIILVLAGCKSEQKHYNTSTDLVPKGSFMGIKPSDTPQMLPPDFINTSMGEYNGTFNPEGTEFFYTVSNIFYNAIVSTRLLDDESWSKPQIASFSVRHDEFDPLFSPDGQSLYFSSHRPTYDGGPTDDSNIWKTIKTETTWSKPQLVPLYGPRKGNYFSSLTEGGDIYFNIWNTGDMYKGSKVDTGYVIESLGEIVNSERGDADPFIAPDESYLIFRSRRNGGLGNGDLWITFNIEGKWSIPQNLGEPINSRYHEMCPYVTTDGKLFVFSSGRFNEDFYHENIQGLDDVAEKVNTWDNGQQNIYTMSTSFIDSLRNAIE